MQSAPARNGRTLWPTSRPSYTSPASPIALATVRGRDAALYRDVNLLGTLRLARAAAEAGVSHFVFMSSIGVNGATTSGRLPFRETDLAAPTTPYARAKAEAESGLAEISAETGMAVTAVRPPMIYGSGAPGSFRTLTRMIGRGLPLPLGSLSNRRAFVAAQNVASFVVHRLNAGGSGFEAFLVADSEQVSTPEFIGRTARAMGRPARLFPFPPGLLPPLLRVVGRGSLVDSLLGSLEIDTGKARATGWSPSVTLDEGLRQAFAAGGEA